MTSHPFRILFLCTGNSARSILAEALLNRLGEGRFEAFSAGSYPKGEVNPHALRLLESLDYPTAALRSKSWDEFAGPDAPAFDAIITVCDNAAGEVCPVWPGQPISAHWGVPDPADVAGTPDEIALAFAEAYRRLAGRVQRLLALPLASLDRASLQQRLRDIGAGQDDAPAI